MSDISYPSLSPVRQRRQRKVADESVTGNDSSSGDENDDLGISTSQSYERDDKLSKSHDSSDRGPSPEIQRVDQVCRHGWMETYGLKIVIVVIGLCIIALVISDRYKLDTVSNFITYEGIDNVLREQHNRFKSQRKETWKSFRSVVRYVFQTRTPEHPGVILMAGTLLANETSHCLMRSIRGYFENHIHRTHSLFIDASSLASENAVRQKILIHAKIEDVIKPVGPFLAITNMEQFSGEAAMILHSYCDNANAQYKEVLYLLQLTIPDGYRGGGLKTQDVEDYLNDLWLTQLGEDKMGSLLSRIGNNIVIIEQEDVVALKCDV